MCLCLSRKLLPWNNRLRLASSPTTFSPSRWWPGFVPFTRRNFCPWMIQLSPSCRSPFQRPVAVWLRASPSNAPFVTLKRRQLVCGVCLPLRLVTCPYLSHILRPPRRRLHLVVHYILALRSREALLDNFLDNLLRSDLLPLSDCSLARRAIRASRRSPPQPPTTGRL